MSSCYREDIGLGKDFYESIKSRIPSLNESKGAIRKLVSILGMDNAVSMNVFARNVGEIVEFDPKKGAVLEKGVVVKVNRKGVDEYYMTRRAVDTKRTHPSALVFTGKGEGAELSPDWVRIDKNVTVDPKTNTLRAFVAEEMHGKTYYRAAKPGEADTVFLNIQNPIDVDGVPAKQLVEEQIDGYQIKIGETEYFRPVSRHQVVDPDGYDKMTGRLDVFEKTEDYTPTKTAAEAIAEADKPMSWYQGHGLLGPAAGAFIGNALDNMGDEDDSNMMMYLGLALGSRRTRGVLKKTYNKMMPTNLRRPGVYSKEVKEAFNSLPTTGPISDATYAVMAKNYNVEERDLRAMVKIGTDVFNLENKQAVASAVLMDRMVMNMAKRDGITKAEMYRKINFEKSGLDKLPADVKFQLQARHASPYFFDKFSFAYMSAGAGDQWFGWGGYFSTAPKTHERYLEMFKAQLKDGFDVDGKFISVDKLGKEKYDDIMRLIGEAQLKGVDVTFEKNGQIFIDTKKVNKQITDIITKQKESRQRMLEDLEFEKSLPSEFEITPRDNSNTIKFLESNIELRNNSIDYFETQLKQFNDVFGEASVALPKRGEAFGYEVTLWPGKQEKLLDWNADLPYSEKRDIYEKALKETKDENLKTRLQKIVTDLDERDAELERLIKDVQERNLEFGDGTKVTREHILDRLDGGGEAMYAYENNKSVFIDFIEDYPKLFTGYKTYYKKYGTKTGGDFYESLVKLVNPAAEDRLSPLHNKETWNKAAREVSLLLNKIGYDGSVHNANGGRETVLRNLVVFNEADISFDAQKVVKYQRDAIAARGAAMIGMDGRAIIYALTDPNVSTPMHEMAHIFEHYLTDAERAVFLKESGSETWDTKTSELFARGFEKFLADGIAPTPELQSLFSRFRSWMLDIYHKISGSEIDITLNSDMRKVYDSMLRSDPSKEAITPDMAPVIHSDMDRRRLFEAHTMTKTHVKDPLEAEEQLGFWQSLKQTIREGGSVWEFISGNAYTQSAWRHLTKFGDAAVTKRFIDGLMNLNNTISSYRGIPSAMFAQLNGGGLGAFREYKERGIGLVVKEIVGDGFSEKELVEMGNAAANRILQTGAVLDADGKLINYSHMSNVREIYEGDFGKEILRTDTELLKTDSFRNYIEAQRELYRRMGRDYIEQMQTRIDKIIANPAFTEVERRALRNFTAENQGLYQYTRELKARADMAVDDKIKAAYMEEYNALKEMSQRDKAKGGRLKFDTLKELTDHHEGMSRVRSMDSRYLPQMVSKRKIEAARKKFYEENGLLDADPILRQEKFNEYMFDRVLEVNLEDPKAKRAILEHDPNTGRFERKKFRSYGEAKASFIDTINGTSGISEELRARALADVDRFILSEMRGTKNPKQVFYISTPADYEINPFIYKYRADFKDFSRYINEGAFVANSNFLDNPRTRVLPMEFLEDDLDVIATRYSRDAGRKIHNMRYGMLNSKELQLNYIDPLTKEYNNKYAGNVRMLKKGNESIARVNSIYNAVNGTHDMTGAELDSYIKNTKRVDTIRNIYQARFGYGFGFYNVFEWAAVGPLITSFDSVKGAFKHYATNKEALEGRIESLKEIGVGNKMIQGAGRDLEDPTMIADSMVDKANSVSGRLSEWMMNFSVSKSLAKHLHLDVEKGGLWRLAFDSFDGSNIVGTAVVAQSAIVEANSLAKILNKMPAEGVLREGGTTYTRGDVVRQLENLGVPADEVEQFARNQEKFAEMIDKTDSNQLHDLDFSGEHKLAYEYTTRILRNAVDTMHGTNRLMRPEGLLSPGGRLLSMYSTYPFNFAVQHVQRRIRQPLNEWFQKHEGKSLAGAAMDTSLLRIMWAYNTNNLGWLRSRGFSEEAIQEFPIDAAIQVGRMMSSMGISIGGLMGLAVVKDVISYPINEVNEQEQWLATRRMMVINQNAPADEQYTWGDLDRDFGVQEYMDMTTYFAGLVARTGAAGRYGDIAMNPWIIRRDGIMGLTPVTGDLNRLVTDITKVFDAEPAQWPTEMATTMGKKAFEMAPLINSSMLTPTRKGVLAYLQNEYGFFATDTETGRQIKMEDLVE